MSSFIVSGDAQQFNAFTLSRQLYSLDFLLGDPSNGANTPAITFGDASTQQFAIRMPAIGYLQKLKVQYASKTAGDDNGTIDFRLWQTPFDAVDRDPFWDRVYEQKAIRFESVWEQSFTDKPLIFANRIAYIGNDPSDAEVTSPRNFMWLEVKPNDNTVVDPIIRVNLTFEV